MFFLPSPLRIASSSSSPISGDDTNEEEKRSEGGRNSDAINAAIMALVSGGGRARKSEGALKHFRSAD